MFIKFFSAPNLRHLALLEQNSLSLLSFAFLFLAFAVLCHSPAVFADGASAASSTGSSAAKSKKTTIDFEDQLIEGSRQKPELFYLLQKKDFNYKRLIRLREDFLPEMRKTAEDIQVRSGGGQ